MATYVKIAGTLYPAEITGNLNDRTWNGRMSKAIRLEMTYADAAALFTDGLSWSIVRDAVDAEGNAVRNEYDNSAYSVAGDITDHRDGTVTAKMGMATDGELLSDAQAALEILGYSEVQA